MKIELGTGWVPDKSREPGHVRSARPGEYAAEIVRLREALYECANLARAWTDKEKEAPDLLDTVYSVASKATA